MAPDQDELLERRAILKTHESLGGEIGVLDMIRFQVRNGDKERLKR
jgi:hypothetical protein